MKRCFWIWAIPLLPLIGADQILAQDESELWRELSARAQNVHYQILTIGPIAGLDFSTYEDDLRSIDEALEALVAAGELKSVFVELRTSGELGKEKINELFPIVGDIGEKYGFFVACEMCDLGARLRFMTVEEDQPLQLHLRLPEVELKQVTERLAELGLTKQTGAEQAETLKP